MVGQVQARRIRQTGQAAGLLDHVADAGAGPDLERPRREHLALDLDHHGHGCWPHGRDARRVERGREHELVDDEGRRGRAQAGPEPHGPIAAGDGGLFKVKVGRGGHGEGRAAE
jgi:hypothetical protein